MPPSATPIPWTPEDFRPIAEILRARQGEPLPPQRLTLVQARLQATLRLRNIPSFSWFHQRILNGGDRARGLQLLIDASTVNHSTFFREPATLRYVIDRVVPRLHERPVRIWSAGCSAGQEPYSLAMLLEEAAPHFSPDRRMILATDLSEAMIQLAASGIYDAKDAGEITPDRLRRFFLRGRGPRAGTIRVAPEIRHVVQFRKFDLRGTEWPVVGPFDAILCRNVTLYFPEAERVPILDRMAGLLVESGHLALGNCEILPSSPKLLVKAAPSIFRKGTP